VLTERIANLTASRETERRGNEGPHRRRKRSAQSAKKTSLPDVDRQFRREIDNGGDPGSNSLHPTAQPTDCPRQCHLRPSNHIRRGFHAPGRLRRRHTSLNRIKQAR
jgi:hypothetical protein